MNHSILAKDLEKDHPLQGLLNKAAEFVPENLYKKDEIYWFEKHYKLDQSSFFGSLSPSLKNDVLLDLNHKSLSLAHYIEKFGLNYGAKMILNADTTEAKSLYALFSGDEVKHRLWIDQFIQRPVGLDIDFHPLLPALALCLEKGNYTATVFSIQVILEGFGLYHYFQLKETCQNLALKEVFGQILKDETLHHGMGVAMMKSFTLDEETKEQITELTALFVKCLLEADWVLKSLRQIGGDLTSSQVKQFKDEIDYEKQLQLRVEKIKSLIQKVGHQGLFEELERRKIFKK